MKIKRFTMSPIDKSIASILAMKRSIEGKYPFADLDQMRGAIHTVDAQYHFDNLAELNGLQSTDISRITFVLVQLRYAHPEGKVLDVEVIHSSENPYMSIDCSGLDLNALESLFAKLDNDVLSQGFYKHSPEDEAIGAQKAAIDKVVEILSITDDLQVRSLNLINSEKDFQNFLYPILRSHFGDLEDEHYLPKYAAKSYQPDFGIPSVKLLVEAKVIRTKSDLKKVQAELHDDVAGYLNSNDKYNKVIAAIYNLGGVAVNRDELRQLESMPGLERALICNSVTPNNLEGK